MAVNRMTSGTSSLGTTSNLYNNAFLEKTFVSSLKRKLLVAKYGKDSTITQGVGATVVRWQYFAVPSALTTALTEGSDPANSTDHTTTTATATLAEYGGFTDFSRFLNETALSGTMEKFAEMLGYQGALTVDTLAISEVDNTSTVVDSLTALTADNVRLGVRALEVNDAQFRPETGGQTYVGFFHADSLYDMLGEGNPAWFQAKNDQITQASEKPFRDTMPSAGVYNTVLYKTNNVQNVSSEYLNVIIADEAFGVAALNTNTMQPALIRTMPNELVSAPVRNRGTIGWRVVFAVKLFDSNRATVVKADI